MVSQLRGELTITNKYTMLFLRSCVRNLVQNHINCPLWDID